jgi:hypothetical protein
MDAQEPASDGGASPQEGDEPQGVFGNLPRTRPGARSPRRDAQAAGERAARHAAPTPDDQAASERPSGDATQRPAAEEPQAGGLEDVAWAGVAAAAEAATIGVRLANRALEAMRDAVERR